MDMLINMKEIVCDKIINANEYNKWYRILEEEIKYPIFTKLNREVEEESRKFKDEVTVGRMKLYPYSFGLPLTDYANCIGVYLYCQEWARYRQSRAKSSFERVGWFKWIQVDVPDIWSDWEWVNSYNSRNLFTINYSEKSITVHDQCFYNYCKGFAEEHKLDTLIKCWDGAE